MEIPGGSGGANAKVPSVGGVRNIFWNYTLLTYINFFSFSEKGSYCFEITFKEKFTTIDIKKKLETILTLITLEHPKFSQRREKKEKK